MPSLFRLSLTHRRCSSGGIRRGVDGSPRPTPEQFSTLNHQLQQASTRQICSSRAFLWNFMEKEVVSAGSNQKLDTTEKLGHSHFGVNSPSRAFPKQVSWTWIMMSTME